MNSGAVCLWWERDPASIRRNCQPKSQSPLGDYVDLQKVGLSAGFSSTLCLILRLYSKFSYVNSENQSINFESIEEQFSKYVPRHVNDENVMIFGLFHKTHQLILPRANTMVWKATKTAEKFNNVYVFAKWSELQLLKHP